MAFSEELKPLKRGANFAALSFLWSEVKLLIFCPPKSHQLDTLIQQCHELGVRSFIPVISDHTENRKLNLNRIRKIIKEAVEQSNQLNIPDIFDPISFDQFLNQLL